MPTTSKPSNLPVEAVPSSRCTNRSGSARKLCRRRPGMVCLGCQRQLRQHPDNLMPDPVKLLSMLRRATHHSRSTPGRRRGVVTLDSADDVLVVGDLHGNFPAFREVLEVSGLAVNPQRHLRSQELVDGPSSYPDDGDDKSHQLVDLVCRPEVRVPRAGPPDPGQRRALRAHRPADRQERSLPQRHFPPGARDPYGTHADDILAAYHRPLRDAAPGRPDAQPRLPLPHDPRRRRPSTASTWACSRPRWSPESMGRGGRSMP